MHRTHRARRELIYLKNADSPLVQRIDVVPMRTVEFYKCVFGSGGERFPITNYPFCRTKTTTTAQEIILATAALMHGTGICDNSLKEVNH
jgi:hypothetical protein